MCAFQITANTAFECVQIASPKEGDSMTSLGNLFQCCDTLSVKFFLMLRWNLLCFSLWPLLPILLLSTTGKSLAPSSWHLPLSYLYVMMRSPLSLLYSTLHWSSARSISLCSRSLIIFVPSAGPSPSAPGGFCTWTQPSRCASLGLSRGG